MVRQAAARLGSKAELMENQCSHFDVYGNDLWDRVVTRTLAFLDKHLAQGLAPMLKQ